MTNISTYNLAKEIEYLAYRILSNTSFEQKFHTFSDSIKVLVLIKN